MRGRTSVLVDDDVRVTLGHEHVTGARVELERDLVRHRRGGQEERCLVPEQRGRALLQRGDRGILAPLLVADLGGCDRRAHAGGRTRRRVGAQVDHRLERYRRRVAEPSI